MLITKRMSDNRTIEQTLGEELEKKTVNVLVNGVKKSFIFLFIFTVFFLNLLAVSISLQCNRDKSFLYKISASMFAFMFGFLYIIINYYMYRVTMKNNPCDICSNNPFPFTNRSVSY